MMMDRGGTGTEAWATMMMVMLGEDRNRTSGCDQRYDEFVVHGLPPFGFVCCVFSEKGNLNGEN
jgi:hypothetical protein